MPPLCIESLKEKHPSYPRNKLLASVFYRAGYIESWGRGILTIISETLKGGLEEPVFKDHVGSLEVTFRRNTPLLGREVTPPH